MARLRHGIWVRVQATQTLGALPPNPQDIWSKKMKGK